MLVTMKPMAFCPSHSSTDSRPSPPLAGSGQKVDSTAGCHVSPIDEISGHLYEDSVVFIASAIRIREKSLVKTCM